MSSPPIDIVHAILDISPRATALALGRVSRAWRAGVTTYHICYYRIPLYRCNLAAARRTPHPAPAFRTALMMLLHAAENGRRIVLELNLARADRSSGVLGWRDFQDDRRMKDIFRAVRVALGTSVVELNIWAAPIFDPVEEELRAVLRGPAPLLQSVTVEIDLISGYPPDGALFISSKLPQDMLGTPLDVPRLSAVSFARGTIFPVLPVPAFRYVTKASLHCSPVSDFDFSAHFPAAHTLDVTVSPEEFDQTRSIRLNFEGSMSLKRLRLVQQNWKRSRFPVDLSSPLGVADLDISGFQYADITACWVALRENHCALTIESVYGAGHSQCFASVTCPGRRLRVCMDDTPQGWDRLSHVCSRVVELRLHHRAVLAFTSCLPVTTIFAALTSFVVIVTAPNEIVWVATQGLPRIFNCPALREICIEPRLSEEYREWVPRVSPDDVDAILMSFPVTQHIVLRLQNIEWTGTLRPTGFLHPTTGGLVGVIL